MEGAGGEERGRKGRGKECVPPPLQSYFDHWCDRRTDGQTDRRTDRILIARPRPRLHSMQRGKNELKLR